MANVNVTYQEMSDAATRLNNGKDSINDKLAELRTFIGELVRSGFVTDQASVKFNETYGKYTESAKQVIDSLQDLASYLTSAAKALEETDTQLASSLG